MDEQKNPLPGVAVMLMGRNLMGARNTVSDAQGAFRFPALPPGEYSVKCVLQGFKSVVQENIRLTTTVSLSVDLVMTQPRCPRKSPSRPRPRPWTSNPTNRLR